MEQLIISLIAGAVGGNIAGGVLKNMSLGTLGNSIAGIVGGGVGGQVITMLGGGATVASAASGGLDIGSIVTQVAAGGIGGAGALALVSVIKRLLSK